MNTDGTTISPQAQRIMDDLASKGGGTYIAGDNGHTPATGADGFYYSPLVFTAFNPKAGYAVAYGPSVQMRYEGLTPQQAEMILRDLANEGEAEFVGTWLDKGIVYFDIVHWFLPGEHARENALVYAWKTGQKAIYDFATGESIAVTRQEYDS
jgi:hypothetical protein